MSDHIQRLADYLIGAGVLDRGDPWLDGLRAVPRELFVPRRAWAEATGDRPPRLIDRDADPGDWLDAVYGTGAVITQRGDGQTSVDDTSAPLTSSISSPHVAAEFLRLLEPARHHRVLEIGTGTGWTAGLLSWWLGDDLVVTIEVDETVSEAASATLKETGLAPTLLVGDGALGAPDHAPYDRVHVTCGVRDVPYAWVEQTRPGGVIALPYMPPHGGWGHQLRLDVLDDGRAIGSFHGACRYMMMRDQRTGAWPPYGDSGVTGTTRLDPRGPWAAIDQGFGLHLAMVAPHITITTAGWEEQEDGSAWVMRLRDLHGPGWALITARPGEDTHISQSGDRQLWSTLEGAYMEWLSVGRPGPNAYRMLVEPASQEVRLR